MGDPSADGPDPRASRSASARSYFAGGPLVLAHRGGAAYPPNLGIENSLEAFRHAVALGCTHVETDVHATADGVPVAFHDSRLDRITDGTGLIGQRTLNELSFVRIGGRQPIPTLAEVLTTFPDTFVNIDLKSDAVVLPALAVIRAAGAEDRVCIGSFNERRLRRAVRASGGRIANAHSVFGTLAVKLRDPTPLARRLPGPGQALQVPETVRGVRVVTARFVRKAHALGKHVHVWTVDDPATMTRLLDLGVDGIVTDRPDLALEVVRGRAADS